VISRWSDTIDTDIFPNTINEIRRLPFPTFKNHSGGDGAAKEVVEEEPEEEEEAQAPAGGDLFGDGGDGGDY